MAESSGGYKIYTLLKSSIYIHMLLVCRHAVCVPSGVDRRGGVSAYAPPPSAPKKHPKLRVFTRRCAIKLMITS